MLDPQSASCLKMSLNVTSYPRLCNVSREAFNILLLRESVWLFANRVKLWRLTPAAFAKSVRVGTYRRSETGLPFSVLSAWAKNCLMQTFTVIAPHNWIIQILPRLIKVVKQCNANVDNERVSCYTLTESKKHTLLLGGTSALFRKDSAMPVCGTSLPLFLNYVNIPQDYKLSWPNYSGGHVKRLPIGSTSYTRQESLNQGVRGYYDDCIIVNDIIQFEYLKGSQTYPNLIQLNPNLELPGDSASAGNSPAFSSHSSQFPPVLPPAPIAGLPLPGAGGFAPGGVSC